MYCRKIILLLGLLVCSQIIFAQVSIKGSITDEVTKLPIRGANVKNIYSQVGMSTDSSGDFTIKCKIGELIEISHIAYATVRVRIKSTTFPQFYNIVMRAKSKRLMEVIVRDRTNINYTLDSIETAEKCSIILAQPKFEDYDLKNGVIGMLSKQQRQKWAFAEMLTKWEQEKYIDYMFNEKKIAKWTNMPEDKLKIFMKRYRPSYTFIRNANEYTFMKYIKDCVESFCSNCDFNTQ
jgi:hypothetical protein